MVPEKGQKGREPPLLGKNEQFVRGLLLMVTHLYVVQTMSTCY